MCCKAQKRKAKNDLRKLYNKLSLWGRSIILTSENSILESISSNCRPVVPFTLTSYNLDQCISTKFKMLEVTDFFFSFCTVCMVFVVLATRKSVRQVEKSERE